MRRDLEWTSRLRGPVMLGAAGWTVAGLLVVQALTVLAILPLLSGTGLPGPVQAALVLVVGTAIRVALGAFVARQALRAGTDEMGDVLRTVIAGVGAGLLVPSVASWLVVRPDWGLGEWAAEIGQLVLVLVLWALPCAWGAHWFTRLRTSEVR